MKKNKKRVIVGMSGGVDSSVVAALLKKRGYDVIGITMQLLPKESQVTSACCNLAAVNDAKRISGMLKIPHYTISLRDTFQENVIRNFVSQYAEGYTPNPCVECNRHIKFTHLYTKAKELDADYIATGHYSKITYSPSTGKHRLHAANDTHKDQSYFLYMLNSEQLQNVLFPLGGFQKEEVRELAHKFNLLNADKPDSHEICFVSQKSYKEFLETQIPESRRIPGHIIDMDGKVLGEHKGIYGFTIGQRKGLGISSADPLYVIKIDSKTHNVTVAPKGAFKVPSISLDQFSLVDSDESILNKSFDIKIRYQMQPIRAKVKAIEGTKAYLDLSNPQEFISPGQSGVLYSRGRVIGGGIIQKELLNEGGI